MGKIVFLTIMLAVLLFGCTSAGSPTSPPTALTITANPAVATLGEIYIQQLTATGGTAPYTWSVVAGSLPNGITLSASGVLSGVPTNSGSFVFTVRVVDSALTVAQIHTEGKIT